jgi:holo-[acyl-carrier protein] synthase
VTGYCNGDPLRCATVIPVIVGTGIDIAEVPRIAASITRFGDRFLRRIFTDAEIRYCESKANRVERYAARFAAKEAAMKAIGTGWNHGVAWRDIEVCRQPGGRPTLAFHGKAAEFAARLGSAHVALSLSHTAQYAIAQVILES